MARTRPTYIYSIISVALVLYILGFFGLMTIHARKLVTLFKEKVDIWLELKPNVPKDDVARIINNVSREPFVKKETIAFITREQAQAAMKEDLGEESMLQDIPNLLRDVVRFNVRADYLQADSLAHWRDQLRQDTMIAELYFEAANTGNIGRNIQNLGWITLGLGFLLIFAAITLIHNTIRLALFSNRFLIKNQELVGASWNFISRPYIQRGILNGLWSTLIALFALIGTLWIAQRLLPDLRQLEDIDSLVIIFASLAVLGVFISGVSTYFVVQRFLRVRVDDLY
jgi:cell division transport system permease protein